MLGGHYDATSALPQLDEHVSKYLMDTSRKYCTPRDIFENITY
jgi:hypothetical protein